MKNKFLILIIGFIIAIDQFAKFLITINLQGQSIELIRNVLQLTYVKNTGGAYGIGATSSILVLIGLNILIIAVLIKLLYEAKGNVSKIALSLVLAGGISNLGDRVFRGFVVDYIDINPIIQYPVFNIADISIVIGIIVLIIYIIKTSMQKQESINEKGI